MKINFLRTTVIEELKEAEVTISRHKFEFVDYRTIVDRFDNNKQLGPTSNEIEDNFYTNNLGPFVIIVTSIIENVFKCLATIENIEKKNFGWYYIGCAKCNKNVKSKNDFWCNHCKSNSNFPIPRYRIQLNVDGGTKRAVFILFDKEAEKLLHTTARELSNKYASMNANSTLPNEIEKLIAKTFVSQLKLNNYNWKEGWELYTIEKVFDNISNDETAIKLDHITTEPLQNDEIKETPD
ncbi:hypothetical protein CFP56_027268 [Quercus suber]|uniref:Replication factor A C-terminal domain-containing protein n=1 Tax=Quercus suber TaxID=58331 RepID=A0AAW0JZ81_QUESU